MEDGMQLSADISPVALETRPDGAIAVILPSPIPVTDMSGALTGLEIRHEGTSILIRDTDDGPMQTVAYDRMVLSASDGTGNSAAFTILNHISRIRPMGDGAFSVRGSSDSIRADLRSQTDVPDRLGETAGPVLLVSLSMDGAESDSESHGTDMDGMQKGRARMSWTGLTGQLGHENAGVRFRLDGAAGMSEAWNSMPSLSGDSMPETGFSLSIPDTGAYRQGPVPPALTVTALYDTEKGQPPPSWVPDLNASADRFDTETVFPAEGPGPFSSRTEIKGISVSPDMQELLALGFDTQGQPLRIGLLSLKAEGRTERTMQQIHETFTSSEDQRLPEEDFSIRVQAKAEIQDFSIEADGAAGMLDANPSGSRAGLEVTLRNPKGMFAFLPEEISTLASLSVLTMFRPGDREDCSGYGCMLSDIEMRSDGLYVNGESFAGDSLPLPGNPLERQTE